jgi:hypothetical protein
MHELEDNPDVLIKIKEDCNIGNCFNDECVIFNYKMPSDEQKMMLF